MTDGSDKGNALTEDEVLVYIGRSATVDEEAMEEHVAFRRPEADGGVLATVKLDQLEMDRLAGQANRIASSVSAAEQDRDLSVTSVTLHVGLSASGHFFFVGAGAEAALDITWSRRGV